MIKKTLYIIISLTLGLLLFSVLKASAEQANYVDYINNAVATKDYDSLERIASYCVPKDADKLFIKEESNGVRVEIYTDITIHGTYEMGANNTVVANNNPPTIICEALELMVFNIEGVFEYTQTDTALEHKAKVVYTFDNGSEIELRLFNGEESQEYYMNKEISVSTFIRFPLFYSNLNDDQNALKEIKVYDDVKETPVLDYTFDTPLSLKNNFDSLLDSKVSANGNSLRSLMKKYNAVVLGTDTESKLTDIFQEIDGIVTGNSDVFTRQLTKDIYSLDTKDILWLVGLMILFVLADGFVGFLLFRKKKQVKRPVRQQNIPPRDHARVAPIDTTSTTKSEDKE